MIGGGYHTYTHIGVEVLRKGGGEFTEGVCGRDSMKDVVQVVKILKGTRIARRIKTLIG